jgi:steroid delta-isomerase-like uncharacterized protein
MERRLLTAGLGAIAALAASPTQAQEPQGRSLATRFASALTAHDIDAFADLFADDYRQHQVSTMPSAATTQTAKQATIAYFAARLSAFPDLMVKADPIVAVGDMVAANFVYTGTQRGAYFGVPPTGLRVSFNSTDILRIEDGRFVEHWGAADIAGLLRQLKG